MPVAGDREEALHWFSAPFEKASPYFLAGVSRSECNLILTPAQVSQARQRSIDADRVRQRYYSRDRQRKFIVDRRDVLFPIKSVYRLADTFRTRLLNRDR